MDGTRSRAASVDRPIHGTPIDPAGAEIVKLRAEVLRLRRMNQSLMNRFGARSADDDRAIAAARVDMQRTAAMLHEEGRRLAEQRARVQEWWQQIQHAKARLDDSWAEMQRRMRSVQERERQLAVGGSIDAARRSEAGRHLAHLAERLEQLVVEASLHTRSEPTPERAEIDTTRRGRGSSARPVPVRDPDVEKADQERFDRFFSDDVEAEPSRGWMLDGA